MKLKKALKIINKQLKKYNSHHNERFDDGVYFMMYSDPVNKCVEASMCNANNDQVIADDTELEILEAFGRNHKSAIKLLAEKILKGCK